jgi:hypothetical protein
MASNATFARAGAGTLYAAWASWTPGPDAVQPHVGVTDIRIQVARRPPGAATFEPPIEISETVPDQLYDKPWMLVTPDDSVLVSYSDLRRGGIWVAASADHGASFGRALVETSRANLAASCPDGSPRGAFLTYVVAGRIRVAHTSDGGATWSAPADVAVADASGMPAFQDPTCVADGEQVWIAYGRTQDSYDTPVERLLAVEVAHAGGPDTIVDHTTTALGAAPNAAFLLFPQLTRLADGRLALGAYRANRAEPGGADLVYALSTDGGVSFGAPVALASGLTPSVQRHVPDWLGDYFGWAATADGLAVAYVDNASGFSHVAFRQWRP